jgi:hypothetical protein
MVNVTISTTHHSTPHQTGQYFVMARWFTVEIMVAFPGVRPGNS